MMIPKRNVSEPLVVTFAAGLTQIIELNERDQSLSLAMILNFVMTSFLDFSFKIVTFRQKNQNHRKKL